MPGTGVKINLLGRSKATLVPDLLHNHSGDGKVLFLLSYLKTLHHELGVCLSLGLRILHEIGIGRSTSNVVGKKVA